MSARQRFLVLTMATILGLATAGPVAAIEPGPAGSVVINLEVTGYNLGSWGYFGGRMACDAADEPIDFTIPGGSASVSSEPITVPPDSLCTIFQLESGDPGDYAMWGNSQVLTEQPFQAPAGSTKYVSVTIERAWDRSDPTPDRWQEFGLDVFTVDRVYLNRSGGITAEGLILCKSFLVVPYTEPYVGIDWDATQYVGRKTAIHGSYRADIANQCFDPNSSTTALRWTSSHPTQQGAVTAWVYGTDGRFGAGSVYVDAAIGAEALSYRQSFDASDLDTYDADCSTEVTEDGYYDRNGDGFCAYAYFLGQHARMTVRTTSVRTR